MLTDRQRFALEWLRSNHQSRSRWMRKGKDAYGSPELWDAIEISGKQGSIVIPAPDWEAIRDLVKTADPESEKMFVPNDAGVSALSLHQRAVGEPT